MRGLRSFGGLVVVLIALGSYLYFVESKRTPGDDVPKQPKVFGVEADKIEEVTIRSETGERTTLKKAGESWQIAAPETAPADAGEVSGIARGLADLEQGRVIEENPSDLKEFGLAEPRVEISFKAGGQEHRLLLGGKTPGGADLYARTAANPRVFLVGSYLDATFNRAPFDLRDKAALDFDREKADALEIVTGARTVRFAKANGEWQIAQPPTPRPDTAAIEGLLSRLDSLQMKKLAAGADEKQYQFDKPQATVRIGTGSAQSTLILGGKTPEGDVFARDAARPAVFTVEASLLDDLKKDAAEYQQKDLFDARAFNTTAVEIARGGQTSAFEKADAKWRQTAPAARDADTAKVDSLLSALTSARADSFVAAAPAAAKPEVTVMLKFDEGRRQERVVFARAGDDAYATREGSPPAKIAASVLDGIVKALDDLK